MYRIQRNDEYLAHHGILGQRWGKRNGPPYPLNESDKSVKEQRLSNKSKSSSNDENKKGLSDAQKRAIKIGAAVTAGALVTAGGVYLYKTGTLQKFGNKIANNCLNGDVGKSKLAKSITNVVSSNKNIVNKEIANKYSFLKDLKNPISDAHKVAEEANSNLFNNKAPLSRRNCKENALTFFLRRQCGKDVVSPVRSVDGNLKDFVSVYFKTNNVDADVAHIKSSSPTGLKYKGSNAQNTIRNYIKAQIDKGKYSEGDCGALGCLEKGHTIAFYIENGEPKFQNIFQDSSSSKASDWLNSFPDEFTFQVCNFSKLTPNVDMIKKLYS